MDIRRLTADDREALEAFLVPRAHSSVFLLSNSRAAGFEDTGARIQGSYLGVFEGDDLVGAAALFWNENLALQVDPAHVPAVVEAMLGLGVRPVKGLLGPGEQVAAAIQALELAPEEIQVDEPEGLYALTLDDLRVPAALAEGSLVGRKARREDLEALVPWQVEYQVEALNDVRGPDLDSRARESLERRIEEGILWVVEEGGALVAKSGFNATLAELVQIGGVYTPPEGRGRGFGRAAVAASLRDVRAEGVGEAVLFTGDENIPAIRAYASLGFRKVGTYRVLLMHRGRTTLGR